MSEATMKTCDRLAVSIYWTRVAMGKAAAESAANLIETVASERGVVNMIFAAAPSQNEFLESLISIPGIPWNRVVAMHMDEYVGLPADAPQRFSRYLDDHIFMKAPFGSVYHLNSTASDPGRECARYSEIMKLHPVDIICMGVGENGHIAFNDPSVADFKDPLQMKVVRLERACREQQVHDGCFCTFDDVPTHAMTLTVPAFLNALHLVCIVPGALKAQAIKAMLEGPITTKCPASILRTHPHAHLFLDIDSASLLR